MEPVVAYRVVVTGQVTGVGFRYAAVRQAAALGDLRGYVRNADDDTVESVIQGESCRVAALVDWFRHGPPGAQVDRHEATEQAVSDGLPPYRIRH